ncbi:MAG: GGDEF domain-containing protein [Myxococcaceae bacterium]|nr:GGDEF domain-containing protein [Myxococcaceae bacterium]
MARTKTVVTVISKISERPTNPNSALVVIYGMELGRKYDLLDEKVVIGRSSKADIQIDQESVSRNHAQITIDRATNRVHIADLGSTNGTWVNDEQILGEYQLRNGDLIKIGRTIFKYIAGGNIEAAYHDEIYRLTTMDGLTQIFNRRYFEEALDREISRCRRYGRALSLILIDIDHFKLINDTYGHLAGDHVLKQLASTVKTKIRREDVFARYGGEEFALLLPEVEARGAQAMAEKTRRLVEAQKFRFDRQTIPVTISLGLATMSPGERDGKELIRAADEKLYAAKQSGRNRVCA